MWSYNTRTLLGFTIDVCGQYTCLFTFMDRCLSPQQFFELFGKVETDLQLETAFLREIGRHGRREGGIRGGQCCSCWKGINESR
jgi:hypothetical protein